MTPVAFVVVALQLLISEFVTADLKDETVHIHNKFRAMHGADPLTWSDSLAKSAQGWADKCIFDHSKIPGVGENLGQKQNDVTTLVTQFYQEVDKYSDSNPVFSEITGHFTQVVWKATKEVACAVQPSCAGGKMWVCHYSPQGNVQGEFAQQVTKGDVSFDQATSDPSSASRYSPLKSKDSDTDAYSNSSSDEDQPDTEPRDESSAGASSRDGPSKADLKPSKKKCYPVKN